MKKIMKKIIILAISMVLMILFLQITVYASAFNPQHIIWDHIPIDVVLPVNHERILTFPQNVQFGYDRGILSSDVLQIQNNNGALYLTAKKDFSPQRVEARLADGKVILLNLSAKADASDVPLSILISQLEKHQNNPMVFGIDYPALLRFAVQQLYAPERLLVKPAYIYRVPMRSFRTVSLFAGSDLDGDLVAMPQIGWRGGDLYITAVIVRNISNHTVYLRPSKINGDWLAVSFFPLNKLSPKGSLIHGIAHDSTTVFLISRQPFAESLGGLKSA